MGSQCWALIALKFTLLKHTWTAGKTFSLVLSVILIVIGLLISAGLSVAALVMGAGMLLEAPQPLFLGVLDVGILLVVMIWFWGLLIEIQRNDVIDFRTMLHLPINPFTVFALNFFASLLSPGMVLLAPPSLALAVGVAFRRGGLAWCSPVIVACFFLMIGAWAYYARGVVSIVMENKRRRRLLLTLLPLFFVILGQLPNILVQASHSMHLEKYVPKLSETDLETALIYGNAAIPPGLLAVGFWGAATGQADMALGALAGLSFFTLLGLGLGYRATLRHYLGAVKGETRRVATAKTRRRKPLTVRKVPFCDEDTAALYWSQWLVYWRHPQIRTIVLMTLVMGGLFLGWLFAGPLREKTGTAGAFFPAIVIFWPFLNFSMMLTNLFGIDSGGLRGMILLPVERHKYILAKNLALAPFVVGSCVPFLLFGVAMKMFTLRTLIIALLGSTQIYVVYCMFGNFMSLFFPFRIHRDNMRANTRSVMMIFVGLLTSFSLGVLAIPIAMLFLLDSYVSMEYGAQWPAGIVGAAVFLLATLGVYRLILPHLGDILLAREQKILEAVIRDRE